MLEALKQYDKELKAEIKKGFAKKNINASGKASNSLRSEITPDNYKLFGAGYIDFAEIGRGKNKNETGGLWQGIYDWLQYKKYGIDYRDDKQRRSITFAIMKTIAKKGTYKHRNPSKRTNVIPGAVEKTNSILLNSIAKFARSSELENLKNSIK